MVPPGTRVVVHYKPDNLTSWGHHFIPGCYIGPSLDHYRYIQWYIPTTGILHITDTLQYIPKALAFLKRTTKDYLLQAIGDIQAIIKYPPKTLPFLSYGDATKKSINHIAHILQRSIAQPRSPILPLPSMLPQSHTPYPSPVIITHTDAPAPRVEPVVQPLRVQTHVTYPISPTRVQHSPSPRLDSFTNPCIKIVYKKKENPHIIPTKQKQASSRQFQNGLCCSPRNGGTNFCTQSSQHLVAHHMFKLPHYLHIYNNQFNKETI